jgi:hypothetical protein
MRRITGQGGYYDLSTVEGAISASVARTAQRGWYSHTVAVVSPPILCNEDGGLSSCPAPWLSSQRNGAAIMVGFGGVARDGAVGRLGHSADTR